MIDEQSRVDLRRTNLVKKHDCLEKEMTGLIGHLHSRKSEDDLFGPNIDSKKYQTFWLKIRENEYLASTDLKKALEQFYIARDIKYDENAKKIRDRCKKDIFDLVDARYSELEEQIRKLKSELGW